MDHHAHPDRRLRPLAPAIRPGPTAHPRKSNRQRVLRSVDDPNEVFVYLEFGSLEDAQEARNRLVASGVLVRFADKHGPTVLTTAT